MTANRPTPFYTVRSAGPRADRLRTRWILTGSLLFILVLWGLMMGAMYYYTIRPMKQLIDTAKASEAQNHASAPIANSHDSLVPPAHSQAVQH